jgi:abequosyltransferase
MLSICIATYNRSEYLFETLDCLQKQLASNVEIVIVDGASTDKTAEVANIFALENSNIHYYREANNSGVDADFDKAVKYAKGKYCWLFSDDDFLINGAIKYILKSINDKLDLLIVNSSVYTKEMNFELTERVVKQYHDQDLTNEAEYAFRQFASYLSFIGAIIVKRDYWLSREREHYHGSEFAHIGVLFQAPPVSSIKFISKPLIIIRYGNSQWANRGFEVWVKQWPGIINKLVGYSPESCNFVSNNGFMGLSKFCFLYRALGIYNLDKYKLNLWSNKNLMLLFTLRLITCIPSKNLNAFLAILIFLTNGSNITLYRLVCSNSSNKLTKWVVKMRRLNWQ